MATLFDENDVKKLIMKCDNEDDSYLPPKDIINSNGSKNYAYVTLIMLGDSYIPGACVLAQSIRGCGSQADLVVLVTNDVSEDGLKALRMYYDKVKIVDYITVSSMRTKYNKSDRFKYLDLVFTKFHLFDLIEYKKLIFCDADALILKHPDHLFTLDAPAGVFLEYKEQIISYDDDGNYVLPKSNRFEWYDMFCKCCGHGELVPKHMTDRVLKDHKSSGIPAGLMLLEPKKGELKEILSDVSKGQMKYLLENKFAWPEQQYLTARYSGKWHNINPVFFGLQGYPHWSILFGLQYAGDKPFILRSKSDMSVRVEYPDFILWHKFYSEMLKDHPNLLNNKSMHEANEMHKHFKFPIKRMEKLSTKENKNNVINKFNLNPKYVHDEHLQYYHTNYENYYRPVNYDDLLFDNIQEYDYIEPIRQLVKYYEKSNINYYKNLVDKYDIPKLQERLDSYDQIDLIDRDEIMLNYVKSRKNIFVISIWSMAMKNFSDIVKFLESNGNVYYTKKINLSKNGIRNLMYWMYDEFTISERLNFIEKKLEYTHTKESENEVGFIYFENTKGHKLSGQGSKFKTVIRNEALKLLDDKTIRGNDIIHINDFHYQTVEYSQLILNSNSLKMLENQDTRKYKDFKMKQTNLKIQTFRKWIHSNLSRKEIDRILIMGSVALYAHTIRLSNDIDGFMIQRGTEKEKDLEEIIYNNLYNKPTKIKFLDFGLQGSNHWRETWEEKNMKVFEKLNISSSSEIVTDPRYHFYFNGLKLYTFDFELVRKMCRHTENDYADFIIMYFYHRALLGKYAYLDANKKLQFYDKLKIQTEKISDDFAEKIKNDLDKKYSENQKKDISLNVIKGLLQ